jgi:hypothetical protein
MLMKPTWEGSLDQHAGTATLDLCASIVQLMHFLAELLLSCKCLGQTVPKGSSYSVRRKTDNSSFPTFS